MKQDPKLLVQEIRAIFYRNGLTEIEINQLLEKGDGDADQRIGLAFEEIRRLFLKDGLTIAEGSELLQLCRFPSRS